MLRGHVGNIFACLGSDVILVDIFIYLFETLLHINETNSCQEIVQRSIKHFSWVKTVVL
jgi:hypothetical protein